MRRAALAVYGSLLLAGCNLLKDLEERKVLAAVVVATPEIAPTLPGFPAGFPAVHGDVVAQVWFAARGDDAVGPAAQALRGIAAADVSVAWNDDRGARHTVKLRPAGADGEYAAGAADGLAYVTGTTYAFEVRWGGEVYGATAAAPAPARAREVPASGWLARSAEEFDEQTLTFGRSGDDLAFYAAFALDPAAPGALGRPTCANLPVFDGFGARDLLDLVADGARWEHGSYALARAPADGTPSCFPAAPAGGPAAYALTLGIARRGSLTDNLFPGSVALAAAVEGAVLVLGE